MLWIVDDRRVSADQHQMVRGRRSRHLREVAVAHRIVSRIAEIIRDVIAYVLEMKARVAGSAHPCQMIVRRIARWGICFEHLERTCTPAGRPRRKSRGRLRFERQYRD